jgi:polyisoprenoid-binding protein YceI
MQPARPRRLPLRSAALLAVLLSTSALALQQTGASEASFSGKGPAGFRLTGKTQELTLAEKGPAVVVTVPLSKLETGISLRDRHMREKYLEVEKYPNAVLELQRSAVQLPADGQTSQGRAKGKMTLHGQTRDVEFGYVIKRAGDTYQVQGTLPLNIKQYGIEIPSYMGITVQPDIETAVSFSFKE